MEKGNAVLYMQWLLKKAQETILISNIPVWSSLLDQYF